MIPDMQQPPPAGARSGRRPVVSFRRTREPVARLATNGGAPVRLEGSRRRGADG